MMLSVTVPSAIDKFAVKHLLNCARLIKNKRVV